jgi:hypothetical protein
MSKTGADFWQEFSSLTNAVENAASRFAFCNTADFTYHAASGRTLDA